VATSLLHRGNEGGFDGFSKSYRVTLLRHSGESRNPLFSNGYKYPGLWFSPKRWFRKKLQMQGAQKLRREAHLPGALQRFTPLDTFQKGIPLRISEGLFLDPKIGIVI
jgi:hypothetical protein